MSGDDASGRSPSDAFDALQISLQEAAVRATKNAMGLPRDLSFHRSLDRKFGKRLDACSARILSLTATLLEYADAKALVDKGKGKRKLENEEDVVDGFHLHVVDVVDQLLERTDTCLDEFLGRTKPAAIAVNPQPQSRHKATKVPRGRLDPALAHASHLPKPQLLFYTPVHNSNAPWRPQLKTKPHASIPLEESLIESVMHPYQYEITHLVPPPHLVALPPPPTPPEPLLSSESATHITHPGQLPALLEALKDAREIAVDLEYHSYRSYAGFVCLMQLSTRTHDWIVDCLVPGVRAELECLNEVFANPNIIKVLHGAESDIVWLQQNFNLYIVNLFDTYHATKVLDFPKHSLAALLEMYCDFTPDKRFQLADWRIRPLPAQMMLYACADTHFLLFIYDSLRRALAPAAAAEVLRRSSETALRTYAQAQDAGGWEALGRRWNRTLVGVAGAVFRAVHAWREGVARAEDESTRYVLANHYVFQLAERPPTDLTALFGMFQGVPPLVRAHAAELLAVIRDAVRRATPDEEAVLATKGGHSDPALHLGAVQLPLDHARIAGHRITDLWDRLRPVAVSGTPPNTALSSMLLGEALSNTPRPPFSAPESALFGSPAPAPTATSAPHDARYQALAARIHASLVIAPTLTLARTAQPQADAGSSTLSPAAPPPPDPTVQAEIPFVPRAQRRTDQNNTGDDGAVVVVGRQKKRKRHESGAVAPKKRKSASASPPVEVEVPDFDYAAAPNVLDERAPTPAPATVTRAKKRRAPGGGVQYGDFGAPPRNRSEMKSGNQSRTFR